MTRQRTHGNDSCFGDWLRAQPDLDSKADALVVNDVDFMFHKYRTELDALGQRGVKLMFLVEAKVRRGMPSHSQREVLFYHHQLLKRKERLISSKTACKCSVWHYGVYVLSLDDYWPEDGGEVTWCNFDNSGVLMQRRITTKCLKDILRFDRTPDDLMTLDIRRHHKTDKLVRVETAPLGYTTERHITVKS